MIASVYVGNGLRVRFSFLRHIRLPAHKSCLQKALGLPAGWKAFKRRSRIPGHLLLALAPAGKIPVVLPFRTA
mgnify:CR=1 FL=1